MELSGKTGSLLRAWWLAALLLQACATAGSVPGGFDDPEEEDKTLVATEAVGPEQGDKPAPWRARSEQENKAARKAELEAAVDGLRGVASLVEGEGTTLTFRFWAQEGAWTLVSWHLTAAGHGQAPALPPKAVAPGLEQHLLSLVGQRTCEVRLTLRRQSGAWRLQALSTNEGLRPMGAKELPVRRSGFSADTLASTHTAASLLTRVLRVPKTGSTSLVAEVNLDDGSVLEITPSLIESHGGPPVVLPPPALAGEVTQALLPFTSGIGQRKVRLRLQGQHRLGEAFGQWRVVEAEMLAPLLSSQPTIVEQHYALHERILREWREQTRENFLWLARQSAEFAATWIVCGTVMRGSSLALDAAAPRLMALLARGGTESIAWLHTFLLRLRPAERDLFQHLWLQAQSRALSTAERKQLQTLLGRFEKLLETRLDDYAKKKLRAHAHEVFYESNPTLKKLLVDAHEHLYPVHHRTPLEYAHLFSEMNINSAANLRGVSKLVHERINNVWTAFRPASTRASPEDVQRVVRIVDRHFERWYNQAYDSNVSAGTLIQAEEAALKEVQALLASIL